MWLRRVKKDPKGFHNLPGLVVYRWFKGKTSEVFKTSEVYCPFMIFVALLIS
jgi:hypothetical protein